MAPDAKKTWSGVLATYNPISITSVAGHRHLPKATKYTILPRSTYQWAIATSNG